MTSSGINLLERRHAMTTGDFDSHSQTAPGGGLTLPTLKLTRPGLLARADARVLQSTLAQLVASGRASSRADLTKITGLARSTVSSYVSQLVQRGILAELGSRAASGRGRPADALGLDPAAGVVLAIDLGARHCTIAIAELGQRILASSSEAID